MGVQHKKAGCVSVSLGIRGYHVQRLLFTPGKCFRLSEVLNLMAVTVFITFGQCYAIILLDKNRQHNAHFLL